VSTFAVHVWDFCELPPPELPDVRMLTVATVRDA
jgi:hypothetical protein